MDKKIFIDCGANMGQSIETFKRYRNDWEAFQIHSFEASPNLFSYFKPYENLKNFTFHPKAVWIIDGEIPFYKSTSIYGSSLNKHKDNVSKTTYDIVPCIDLSKWITDSFNISDFIILKLDVEGSEYEILRDMIDKRSLEYIDILFVEFHDNKLENGVPDSKLLIAEIKSKFTNLIVHENVHTGLNFIRI